MRSTAEGSLKILLCILLDSAVPKAQMREDSKSRPPQKPKHRTYVDTPDLHAVCPQFAVVQEMKSSIQLVFAKPVNEFNDGASFSKKPTRRGTHREKSVPCCLKCRRDKGHSGTFSTHSQSYRMTESAGGQSHVHHFVPVSFEGSCPDSAHTSAISRSG